MRGWVLTFTRINLDAAHIAGIRLGNSPDFESPVVGFSFVKIQGIPSVEEEAIT